MRTLLFLCCLVVACTDVMPCAAYDPVVGQTAVELAAAAYCSAEQLKENTRSCTDFDGCLLDIQVLAHDDVESQGYVAYVPARNWIVVVFRGSDNLQNLINDGKFHQVPYPNAECTDTEDNEPCMVHLGFLQYFLSLRDQMIDALTILFALTEHDGKNPDVLVVGHSLGGAAALLAALDILTHDSFKALFPTTKRLSLYTFGQPRVGDPWFVAWASRVLSHSAYFRVTHRRDPVPHLPPQVFYDITNDGYLHVPPEVFFNNNLGGRNFVMCEDDPTQEDENCSNIFSWHNPSDHSLYLNTALDCVLPIPSLQGDSSAATDSSSASSSSPTSPPEGSSDGSSSSTRPPSSTLPPSTSGPPESLPEMPPTPLQYVYSEPSCSSALSWTGTLNVLNTAKVLTPCSFDSCCAAHSECSMSCDMPETIQRCLTAFLDCMQSACSVCAIKSSSLNQQRTSFFDQDACALRALSLVAAVSERAYEIAQRQCARPGPSGLTRGDPHLLTFRHFSFDFQPPGEYVLVRSTDPLNWPFEVQVRQALMETSNSISLNKGIAISLGNSNVTLTLLASSRTAQFENDTLFSSGRGDVLFGGGFGTVGNGSVLRIRFVSQQPPSDFDIPSSLDSFGYYLMDADGHPSVGRIVWPNIRMVDDNATFDLPEVVEGTLGFFLLPGGAQYNDIHVGDEVHFELELPPPVTRPSIPDETPRELRYFLVYAETVTSESVVPRCKKLCGDAGGVPGRIFTPEQQQQVTSLVDFESQIIFAVAAQRGTGEDVFKWYWVNETTRVQFYDENSGVCSEGFFCNWLSGEPNNWHSNEPLMVLNYDWYRAKWNDYHDDWSSRQSCLCEKKAPSRAYTLANTKLIAVHQPSPSQVAIVDQCLETCRSAGGVPGTILTAEDQRQVDDVVAALNGPVYATAAKRASRNPSVWYWDHSDGLDRTLLYDMNTGVCGSFCNWHPGEPNWWGEPLIIINYEGRGGTWTDISEYSSSTPTCLCRVPTGEITPPTDGPTTRVDVRSNSSCRNASLTIPVRPVTDFIHVKYYVISIEAFSFEGCIKRCGTHNSSFGVILSEEQQQQARRVIRTNTTTMLAGRLSPDGNWRWEAGPHAGEMFGYTYFEGEPNQFFNRSTPFLRMSPLGGWEPMDGTASSSTTHPSSIMCLCQQWRLATVAQRRQTPNDFSGRWIVKSTQTGAVLNGAFRAVVVSTSALHAMGGVVTFDRASLNAHRCIGTDVVKRRMSDDTTEHRWCTFLHPANDSCTSLVYSLFSVPTYVAGATLVGSHESDVFGCREPGLTRVQRFDASNDVLVFFDVSKGQIASLRVPGSSDCLVSTTLRSSCGLLIENFTRDNVDCDSLLSRILVESSHQALAAVFVDDRIVPLEVDSSLSWKLSNASLRRRSAHEYRFVGNRGDQVIATVSRFWGGGYIDVQVILSAERPRGTVEGLLGCTDESNYALHYPNGTGVSMPITANTMFNDFANAWKVSLESTRFFYHEGENSSSFDDPRFISRFVSLDDFSAVAVARGRAKALASGFDESSPLFRDVLLDIVAGGFEFPVDGAATNVMLNMTQRLVNANVTVVEVVLDKNGTLITPGPTREEMPVYAIAIIATGCVIVLLVSGLRHCRRLAVLEVI